MKNLLYVIFCFASLFIANQSHAQYDPTKGCIVGGDGNCAPNVVLSAMPFLRIAPDARAGALGDAGIASSADANSMHFNASKLAFVQDNMSFSATYTPWLRSLGLQDVYMAYLSGYKKVDDLSAVGFGLRYFSLGDINFTNIQGIITQTGKPRELEFAMSYARKLSSSLSLGLSAKYIYSNLASGQNVGGFDISTANAFATDISMTYKKEVDMSAEGGEFTLGLSLSNLGSKISYIKETDIKDFLPANLGIGAGLNLNFDEYNSITFLFDINKLLIPTPVPSVLFDENGDPIINPEYDKDPEDNIADYRQQSMIGALFSSFGDAQGGFSEELKEFNTSLGVEYWYDQQFAFRVGYYYEHPLKGDRQFLTVGAGIKYNVFGIDISYLVPTNNRRNPLDNTLRFSLLFDFEAFATN